MEDVWILLKMGIFQPANVSLPEGRKEWQSLPKINIESKTLKNGLGLEDEFSFWGPAYFQGLC